MDRILAAYHRASNLFCLCGAVLAETSPDYLFAGGAAIAKPVTLICRNCRRAKTWHPTIDNLRRSAQDDGSK
jgi:hypothetical protein